jgi:hypothetical protein
MRRRRAARREHLGNGRGHVALEVIVEGETPSMWASQRGRIARPVTPQIDREHVESERRQPSRQRNLGIEVEADVIRPHPMAQDDGMPASGSDARTVAMQGQPPAVVRRGEVELVGSMSMALGRRPLGNPREMHGRSLVGGQRSTSICSGEEIGNFGRSALSA